MIFSVLTHDPAHSSLVIQLGLPEKERKEEEKKCSRHFFFYPLL
jgi:hypothetical protein